MIQIELHTALGSQEQHFQLDVSFSVNEGDFIAIYGDSGAGKTTLLRMIAGLMKADSGKIEMKDETWYNSVESVCLTPQKRNAGMVFQDYALFPNMTVKQNLEFALKKEQNKDIIAELIDIFELKELQNQKSNKLSGGQKQRVALARALVQNPKVLLLDEPMSALDDKMRQKLQKYLRKVHDKYGLTTFIVSHDVAEVFKLCNKVIKIENGKIADEGTPEDVFLGKKPAGKFNVIGTILTIRKENGSQIANVIVDQNIIEVVLSEEESYKTGDKVMVFAEDFTPSLVKI